MDDLRDIFRFAFPGAPKTSALIWTYNYDIIIIIYNNGVFFLRSLLTKHTRACHIVTATTIMSASPGRFFGRQCGKQSCSYILQLVYNIHIYIYKMGEVLHAHRKLHGPRQWPRRVGHAISSSNSSRDPTYLDLARASVRWNNLTVVSVVVYTIIMCIIIVVAIIIIIVMRRPGEGYFRQIYAPHRVVLGHRHGDTVCIYM